VALPVECLECRLVFQGTSLVGRVEDVSLLFSSTGGQAFPGDRACVLHGELELFFLGNGTRIKILKL
jgi:hypothetical protein